VYATINLSGIIDDEGQGFGALSFAGPAAGIQNGVSDGIALIAPNGTVIQFLSYEGVITAAAGTPAGGMTSIDVGVAEDGGTLATDSLQATGTGAGSVDFTFQAPRPSSFGQLNDGQVIIGPNGTGQVSIGDASVVEGDSGVQQIIFTVRRGGGSGQVASVDYSVNFDGTATTDDFAPGLLTTGTVTFGIGETVRQIIIGVNGDTIAEGNETFSITLSNPVGNIVITDGNATGTIINDDPIALAIYQIQGESHRSAVAGQTVITGGIVTAVDSNGFYVQDATGDANARTSDAIFVLTTTAPTVAVGDNITVRGRVEEFLPGNNPNNLTTTQIAAPMVTILSSGNALPAAALIGTGGRLPPSTVFEDDGFTSFDPLTDAADFYESLEGMRVTIDAPLVTSATNSFGETQVVASGGVGATGVNARGGITVGSDSADFNPERIQIDDDSGIFAGFVPNFGQGDRLGSVTGVVSYNFSTYEVLVTEAVTVTFDAPAPTREVATIAGTADRLSIATYNLENLDPTDTKFDILARDIAFNLRGPDILAVQEIQDADGAGTGSNLSGTVTANLLISAIRAAGGPNYAYVEVAPTTPNSTGGEPNGNIRNGFFYNVDRVSFVANSAVAVPGSAFNGSRQPLAAQFVFNDQIITAISVHSTSRGGSTPLFGAVQPPVDAGDGARTAQATALRSYIDGLLGADPAANIAVLGDFNGFTFENAIQTLEAGGALTDLNRLLAPEERYSFVFDGNAQALDHILVTAGLAAGAEYDAVHINSEQPDTPARGTDHDPQVATFLIARPNQAPIALADAVAINEDATTDNLVALLLGNDSDPNPGDTIRITAVDDSATLGSLIFDPVTQTLRYVADDPSFDAIAPGATVTDTFTYTITDSRGLTSTATVTVTVTGIADGIIRSGTSANDTLNGTSEEDQLFGLTGNDILNGFAANDQLFGGAGSDRLFGGDGADGLFGGLGNDILDGGNGNDRLLGEGGTDTLTGGAGSDIFVFSSASGRDTITDFDTVLDRILLENGINVQSSTVSDVNRDGRADLTLNFSTGNSVALLGVSDFNLVNIDRVGAAPSAVVFERGIELFNPHMAIA
jgi:predicted extracellular nuclease